MKKILLSTILSISLLNSSCASIKTKYFSEKKDIVIENIDSQKELIKSNLKPSFESIDGKNIKIKLFLENTYSSKKTQIISSNKSIPWEWSLLTLAGTALVSIFVPISNDNSTNAFIGIGLASSASFLGDLALSFYLSNEKEIKDLGQSEFIETQALPFAKVVFLNSKNQESQAFSDEKGELVLNNSSGFLDENSLLKIADKNYLPYKMPNLDLSDNIKPKNPPILYAKVKFNEPSKTGVLNAMETGYITIEVTNKGKSEAKKLTVKLIQDSKIKGIQYPEETNIQKINSNETKEINIPITGEFNLEESNAKFTIEVQEPFYQADADPIILSFKTRALKKPDLFVEEIGLEDEVGNKFTLGKETIISAIIRNKGNGIAKNVTAEINLPSSNGVNIISDNLDNNSFNLGDIEAGGWKKLNFTIFAPRKYNKEEIPFSLILSESRINFSKKENLKIAVNKPMKKIEEVIITSNEEMGIKKQNEISPTLNIDVDNNIPNRNIINSNGIAVIIGNKNYENKDIPTVEYAIRDAKIMKEYLQKTLGYKEENIIYLENATSGQFIKLFGSEKNPDGDLVRKYIEAGKSDVFIYYSGHGAPDIDTKSTYFVPVDTAPDSIALNGYSLDTFYTNLSKYKAKSITVVLDSCFSGNSKKGMIIKSASPLFIDVKNSFNLASNIDVLTSSSGEQISSWYDDKKHSLFTYYFFKALQLGNNEDEDKINPDINKDNSLSLEEIHNYISIKVKKLAKRLHGRDQTPQLMSQNIKKIISKF